MRTTFAAYELERDNIAIADATGFTQQSGDQRSRGVEVEAGGRAGSAAGTPSSPTPTPTPSWCASRRFDPAAPDDRVDYSGNTPILAPEHLANLWVSKSSRNGGLRRRRAGSRYVGEQFIAPRTTLFELDATLVLDAGFYDIERLALQAQPART